MIEPGAHMLLFAVMKNWLHGQTCFGVHCARRVHAGVPVGVH
jgi:hypothetical protein